MGYSRETIRGISWVGGLRLATRFIAFARTIVIARILSPADFGSFSIIALLLSSTDIFTDTGLDIFLLQEKGSIKKYISSAWILSIARGLVLTILVLCFTPFVIRFFRLPSLLSMLLLASLVPLIKGFTNPAIVVFQKQLEFNKDFYYQTSVFAVDSISALSLTYILRSPIGLVGGLVIGALFELFLSFFVVKMTPRFQINRKLLARFFYRGKWLTLAGIFHYLYQNADDIIVGRILGAGQLGLYTMAYKFSLLPLSEISDVVQRVTFPVYVKIANDPERLKSAFLKTTSAITFLTLPIGLFLFLYPKEILGTVLGNSWINAAPALQVLAIFGIVHSVSGSASSLFLSLHKQKMLTLLTLVKLSIMLLLIFPFIFWFGLVGAGLAALIASLVGLPVAFFLILSLPLKKDELGI